MRAAFAKQQAFYVKEIETPKPQDGQVLVRVLSCGICGSDLHLFKNAGKMVQKARDAGYPIEDLDNDLVLGHEFVAEIVEFGPNTNQTLSVGDRVCSMPFLMDGEAILPIGATKVTTGAYAEYMVLSESLLLPIPDSLTNDAAALTEPLAIGVHAVAKANITDEPALVIGCGPIGLAAVCVLKHLGFTNIIASDFSEKRRELALEMGATEVLNPKESSPYDALTKLGSLNNVIFECAGVQGLISEIILMAPRGSKIVVAGICTEDDTFSPMVAVSKEVSLQFVTYYTPEEFAEAMQMLANNEINWQPWITGKVGLDGIAKAFDELEDPELHAKVIIEPWKDK